MLNRDHLNTVQETLALHGSCCASNWARWWDWPSMSVISSSSSCLAMRFSLVFFAIFLRDWTSSRSWLEVCLYAWSWDWRSRTDPGCDFSELVSSNLNTASRHDFSVVSLSSRCFAFFAAIYVGFVSQSSADLCVPSRLSPWNKQKQMKKQVDADDRFSMYISKEGQCVVNLILENKETQFKIVSSIIWPWS
jgi:hypothetical protein